MATTLYQLELDQDQIDCGSSHIIQLQSSSFIIFDGGYFTPGEEDRLYRFLTKRCNGTPVITAWFFSHAHPDHVGNFIQFIRKYRAKVRIQRILYNFQPIDLTQVAGDWKSSVPATIKGFYDTLSMYCATSEKVVLHTGDVFTFDELTLEVLYTYEDIFPDPALFNDYSTVIMTSVGIHRILWLGDAYIKTAEVLLKQPEKLRCDIVQVAHHGVDDHERLCALYAATGASVALWPVPDYRMVDRKDLATNHFLLYETNIQEHLVSGYGTLALPLPYSAGMAKKDKKALSLGLQPDHALRFDSEGTPSSAFRYLTPECVEPVTQDKTAEKDYTVTV